MNKTTLLSTVLVAVVACHKTLPESGGNDTPPSASPEASNPPHGELFRAVVNGDTRKVEALLGDGVDPNEDLGDPGGELTPLLAAIVRGNDGTAALLLRHGASAYARFGGFSLEDFAIHKFGNGHLLTRQLRANAQKEEATLP